MARVALIAPCKIGDAWHRPGDVVEVTAEEAQALSLAGVSEPEPGDGVVIALTVEAAELDIALARATAAEAERDHALARLAELQAQLDGAAGPQALPEPPPSDPVAAPRGTGKRQTAKG